MGILWSKKLSYEIFSYYYRQVFFKHNKVMIILRIIFLIILFFAHNSLFSQEKLPDEIEKQLNFQSQKFKYILEIAYRNHIDSINIEAAAEAAFKAMLKHLDAQSNYFSAEQMKELQERELGAIEGTGIQVAMIGDTAIIASVSKGSPADSAGIKRGELLLFLNDGPVTGKKTSEINTSLSGKAGTYLSLITKCYRNGILNQYNIIRNRVALSSVTTAFIYEYGGIGYIASNRFTANIDTELVNAIIELQNKGMKQLILDLRGNPGGFLDQVCKLLDEFLDEGHTLTYTNSKNPAYNFTYKSSKTGRFLKLPLVVLIDNQSSSASEIFAGTIQDLDRGLVIGTNSFGKGTIQKSWTLNDGSGFRITVGEYHTSSGRRIDKSMQIINSEPQLLDESLRITLGEDKYNELQMNMQQTSSRKQLPIHQSKSGRPIIGGGGIFPDIRSFSDTLTLLSRVLQSNGIILEFAYIYFKKNEEVLRLKNKTIEEYLKSFNLNNEEYNDFVNFSLSKNIWNKDMAKRDDKAIKNLIKATIAHFLWDNFGYQAVKVYEDDVFIKSINEMSNAKLFISN